MFTFFQKIIPQHGLSKFLARFARSRNEIFKNWAIKIFSQYFKVDLTESLITDVQQFASFNDFFIRRLKPDARPFPEDPQVIMSPADGVISEFGKIDSGRLLQAKGKYYRLQELLGNDHLLADQFSEGEFLTIYLAPKDYHRVHMPIDGVLKKMIHVPGKLFSVNAVSVNGITNLFSRNERVICLFETARGPMAVIFVGALLIGSVVTSWHGSVLTSATYNEGAHFPRGEELGYFQWGSTVIVLFAADQVNWQSMLRSGDSIQMGKIVGVQN